MIRERFNAEKESKTFKRIDENHPLDIFVGYSNKGNPCMVISVVGKEKIIQSSQSIEVNLIKLDNMLRLSFSLIDKDKESVFYKFCEDIVESTRKINSKKSFDFIISRWNKWRSMFKKQNNQLLSENQIVGLIGELLFIEKYMIPQYGIEKSIIAWQGPSKNHKDFEIEDTWYEIKTIGQAALTIKISSVEQLDSTVKGNLEVVVLNKTNEEFNNSISLNKIVEVLSKKINSFEAYRMFQNKLLEAGYSYDEEYENYVYKYIKRSTYLFNDDFPRVRLNDLSDEIVKVSYEILLKDIERFKKKVY